MNDLTRDEVAALLTYDPETGVFRWKVDRGQRVKVGDIAGTEFNGYRRIRIKGRAFKAHRLAFLLMTGAMPSDQVDHINGQKDDNRCPLMGGQASVHRIDDLQSYTLGSLEWATKAVQATEKASEKPGDGCKVKWQGRYISDRQLVDKLKELGIEDKSQEAIKQFRKNHRNKYQDLDALHEAMLKKWGALKAAQQPKTFKHLPDFLGEAPMLEGLYPRDQWEMILKAHKALRLSPLEVQRKVALELEKSHADVLAKIGKEGSGYKDTIEKQLQVVQGFIRKLRLRIEEMVTKQSSHLHELKLSENPDKAYHLEPAGFGHYPAAVQSIAGKQAEKPELESPPAPVKWTVAGKEEVEEAMKLLGLS